MSLEEQPRTSDWDQRVDGPQPADGVIVLILLDSNEVRPDLVYAALGTVKAPLDTFADECDVFVKRDLFDYPDAPEPGVG